MRISDWSSDVCSSDLQALVTRPPSTSTSTRRWPSMRVMGSITTRVMWLSGSGVCGSPRGRMQNGELLDEDQVQQNLQRGDTQGHQKLRCRREVLVAVDRWLVGNQIGIDEIGRAHV